MKSCHKKRNIPTHTSHIAESRVLLTPSQAETRTQMHATNTLALHLISSSSEICVPSARQRPAQRYISWKIRAAAELLHSIQVFSKTRARCGTFCDGCCKGASTACLWKHSVQLFRVFTTARPRPRSTLPCVGCRKCFLFSRLFLAVASSPSASCGDALNRWCALSLATL